MSKVLSLDDLKLEYIGKVYELLTVIDVIRENRVVKLVCQCQCGTIRPFSKSKIITGRVRSCGCYKKYKNIKLAKDLAADYVGKVYGWLTILDVVCDSGSIKCKCQCKCGNIKYVTLRALKTKHTTSCGCYKRSKEKGAKCSQWRKENPEKVAAINRKHRQWFKDNPDKVREQAENFSKFCKENPEVPKKWGVEKILNGVKIIQIN